MAYQTGTATSPTDLLQGLVTFMTTNGWTQDMSQALGSGWRAHLHKGSLYINFRASHNETGIWAAQNSNAYTLNCYTGTGFNSGAAWNAQAGGPIGNGTSNIVGAAMNMGLATYTYFFFQDAADNVIVVVERTPAWYVYLGWGPSLNKVGAWTGGMYCFGSNQMENQAAVIGLNNASSHCPFQNGVGAASGGAVVDNSFIRADVDAFTGKFLSVGNDTGFWQRGYTGKLAHSSVPSLLSTGAEGQWTAGAVAMFPNYWDFANRFTSAFNARANLLPVLLFAARDAGGWSLLGTVPSIFRTTGVGQGFAPATVYTVGPDNYMMFPNFAVKKV